MAKDKAEQPDKSTRKFCECGARIFQGPFTRGEIIGGALQVRETLYQCVNCHRVKPLEQISDEQYPPAS